MNSMYLCTISICFGCLWENHLIMDKKVENKKGWDSPPAWRNQSTNLFRKIFLINYIKQIFDKRMRRFIAKMPGNCWRTIGFSCILQAGRFRASKIFPGLGKPQGYTKLKILFHWEWKLQSIENWDLVFIRNVGQFQLSNTKAACGKVCVEADISFSMYFSHTIEKWHQNLNLLTMLSSAFHCLDLLASPVLCVAQSTAKPTHI